MGEHGIAMLAADLLLSMVGTSSEFDAVEMSCCSPAYKTCQEIQECYVTFPSESEYPDEICFAGGQGCAHALADLHSVPGSVLAGRLPVLDLPGDSPLLQGLSRRRLVLPATRSATLLRQRHGLRELHDLLPGQRAARRHAAEARPAHTEAGALSPSFATLLLEPLHLTLGAIKLQLCHKDAVVRFASSQLL